MQNGNLKLKIVLIILFSIGCFNVANAYDDQTTHPALTDEIVDFYNLSFPDKKITPQQKEWIVEGSILEDTPPRWINHFYDPISKSGWSGEHAGKFDAETVRLVSQEVVAPFGIIPVSSLNWMHNEELQAQYGFYKGAKTWERGILEMIKGNEKESYQILGYILHLIEDVTVPEHTRNDTHAHELEKITNDYGSPYEEYLKKYNRQNLDIASKFYQQGLSPINRTTIDDYLVSLAEYSNKYFFSKDTINDPKYQNPKIIRDDGSFGYGKDENGNDFPLVKIKKQFNNQNEFEKLYLLDKAEPIYYPILDAYFSRLSRQAVLNGAGVIDLFHKDIEFKKEYSPHLIVVDLSPFNYFRMPNISLTGEMARIKNVVQSVFAKVESIVDNTFSSINNLLGIDKNSKHIQQFSADANKIIAENFQENILENKEPAILIETENQIVENLQIAEQQPQQIQEVQQIMSKPNEEVKKEIQEIIEQPEKIERIGIIPEEQIQKITTNNKIVFKYSGGGSGSGSSNGGGSSGGSMAGSLGGSPENTQIIYPQILISEIQLASTSSVHKEFVELYNPNNESVDLTDWYVQKKTANGANFTTFATANSFNGKTIDARGYFLVGHSSSTFSYDIAENYGISDNNTLALKNPNGEIVDKVGWGTANNCEGVCALNPSDGQSVQRIFQNNEFTDTDNNSQDFEIQTCPSPGAQSADCQLEQEEQPQQEEQATSTESHLVISEIQVRGDAQDDEFIEIYNPSDSAVSLNDYSIQYLSGTATSTANITKKNFSNSAQIAAKSFYLSVNTSATSSLRDRTDMTYSAFSLSGSSNGATIFLISSSSYISDINDSTIIDSLSYGSPALSVSSTVLTVPAANQSLERKALVNNQCALIDESSEYSGNGCDTDSGDDWQSRSSSNSQNSQNFPEPRSTPTAPQNFSATYTSSTMSIDLTWSASQDYSGAPPAGGSNITYRITDISVASTTLSGAETTSTAHSFSISETGRNYDFSIQAFDNNGLNSATSTVLINIPYSTLIIAQQLDMSLSEQGTGNGQFYQYLGNGLLGSPESITFHAKFLSGSNNPAFYFEAAFWQSDNPDYSDLTLVSTNTCYRTGSYGPENNCPDFGFQYNIDKDYTIPIQQNFTFNPNKYYKIKFYTYQATAVFYGSSDIGSYKYGETARDSGGIETNSSIKDIYFKIEAVEPIQIFSDVNIAESVPQNFEINYSTSTLELSLAWDKPRYFDENSPALAYRITDSSYLVSSSTLVLSEINTSATSTTITIREVGREYKFSIQAFTNSGSSTLSALSEDIFTSYSLLDQYVIAQQSDYSVSEAGSGNGEFYQTVGNNLSGDLGAIAIKFSGPTPYYLSVRLYQYADSNYSSAEDVRQDVVFCTNSSNSGSYNYPSPQCSDYYLDSNTVTIPVRNNFTFNPEKYYKFLFITYQSWSTFYGSADENSYSSGQSTKNSGGVERLTDPIKDVYFKVLSATPL